MKYFEQDFLDFFTELTENNRKEWFDENRKRYEKIVKDPFKHFVGELISELSADDPTIRVEPRDCIFRINRDIRFAKDKTPYKTDVSAAIAPGGRKNMATPGVYVKLCPIDFRFYSGMFQLDKTQLHRVRSFISANMEEFKRLIEDKAFVSTFGEIHGEKNKVVPKEFKEEAQKEPILANKQFYFYAKHNSNLITSDKLMSQILENYKVAKPLIKFFREALEE